MAASPSNAGKVNWLSFHFGQHLEYIQTYRQTDRGRERETVSTLLHCLSLFLPLSVCVSVCMYVEGPEEWECQSGPEFEPSAL